jgi:hypothetical protein
MKAVRWLGLFGEISNFSESLKWELSQTKEEVCAEILRKDGRSRVPQKFKTMIGLRVHPKAVVKVFKGDVFSYKDDNGRLRKQNNPKGRYKEGWVFPQYIGFVLYSEYSTNPIDFLYKEEWETLRWFSRNHKLPIYVLRNGEFSLLYGEETKK